MASHQNDPVYKSQLIIGGKSVDASGAATFTRTSPVSGKTVNEAAAATVDDANAACEAAARAFRTWSQVGPHERRKILLEVERVFQERSNEIIAAAGAELGAAPPWAAFNVILSAGLIREAAALTTQITGQTIPSDEPGMMVMSYRRPVGTILSIAPWNAPVILSVRAIAMPLACGNCVILKGSETCPEVHRLVVQCFVDAGVPEGVISYVVNAPKDSADVVGALIAHPTVKRINFTGSSHTGSVIAAVAAKHLKPCLLELGGKSPLVILDDADVDQAVLAANFGSFMNTGQICMSTERIVLDNAVADEFVEKFVERARNLGFDDSCGTRLGPMALSGSIERLEALINDAVAKGAKAVLRGGSSGSNMSPTILDHVTPDMDVYYEETFGPITTIVRVDGADQAVEVANDSDYGLAGAVFGQEVGRAMDIASRIEAGQVHVNGPTIHDQPQVAFGGLKASGYGRFNGIEAINEFTDTRVITVRRQPAHYPI